MGSKIEYVESSQLYTTSYIRNSKAIAVLWGVFTICCAIIIAVVFVQPQWIGDTRDSKSAGYYGLWKFCAVGQNAEGRPELICKGRLDDFYTILNTPFRLATIFVALSLIIVLLCICSLMFFLFLNSPTVFRICGWMEIFAGICLAIGIVVFPVGWDSDDVRVTCGEDAHRYSLGTCGIRWSYMLAVIAFLDVFVLAILAFVLASRHIRLQSDQSGNGSIYKGELNSAFVSDGQSLSGSRKSLNLQPILLLPQPEADRFSEFSQRTGRSKSSNYRAEYASSIQNFQL